MDLMHITTGTARVGDTFAVRDRDETRYEIVEIPYHEDSILAVVVETDRPASVEVEAEEWAAYQAQMNGAVVGDLFWAPAIGFAVVVGPKHVAPIPDQLDFGDEDEPGEYDLTEDVPIIVEE